MTESRRDITTAPAVYADAWAMASTDPRAAEWGAFYPAANLFCAAVAAECDVPITDVASVVALVSPRMPWGRNQTVARRIVRALAQSTEARSVPGALAAMNALPALGITHERRGAVARYWTDGTWNVKALKTTAFRQNLLGDYRPATIDTWMAGPFIARGGKISGRQYGALAAAITFVADTVDEPPAHVQAVLWGYFRQDSGWARHDKPLEVAA